MGKKREAIKPVEKADVEVSRSISGYRHTLPAEMLGAVGKLSDQPPIYAFIGGLACAALIRRDRRLFGTSARMLAAHWIGIRLKNATKSAVDRTRPRLLLEEGRYEAGKGSRSEKSYSSFPSGHTVGAVAIARALMRDYPETATVGYLGAAAAALGRIAKCDHFPSDTAAGAVIGYVAEAVVPRLSPDRPA